MEKKTIPVQNFMPIIHFSSILHFAECFVDPTTSDSLRKCGHLDMKMR